MFVVALWRAWPTPAPFGWSLGFALAVAVLAHLIESQSSLLALPPEGIFWLLAGMVVAAPGWGVARAVALEAAPAEGSGTRRDRRGERGAPLEPRRAGGVWAVGAYAGVAVLTALIMLQLAGLDAVLVATILVTSGVLGAAVVGALALAPPATPRPEHSSGAGRALALVALVALLALAGAAIRSPSSPRRSSFTGRDGAADRQLPRRDPRRAGGARPTPTQAEYYHILGQSYGAWPAIRANPHAPTLRRIWRRCATNARRSGSGAISFSRWGRRAWKRRRGSTHWRPATTRPGELHRYWAEVAAQPERFAPAIASFARAATLKPNDVEVHAGLSDSYLLAGDPVRAFAEGREAEGLLPGYWYAYAATARAALALGDATTAVTAAGDALRYATANSGVKAPTAYELERLRQVVAQAIATGTSPIRAGALLRNDTSASPTVWTTRASPFDASCRGRQLPGDRPRRLPPPRSDPPLLLPQGPDLTGC